MKNFLARFRKKKTKIPPRPLRPVRPTLPAIDVKDVDGKPQKLQFIPCVKESFEQMCNRTKDFRNLDVTRALPAVDCRNILCYLEFVNPKKEENSRIRFHPKYTGRMTLLRVVDMYTGHPAISKGYVVVSLAQANVCDEDMERVALHKDRIVTGFNDEGRAEFFPSLF